MREKPIVLPAVFVAEPETTPLERIQQEIDDAVALAARDAIELVRVVDNACGLAVESLRLTPWTPRRFSRALDAAMRAGLIEVTLERGGPWAEAVEVKLPDDADGIIPGRRLHYTKGELAPDDAA